MKYSLAILLLLAQYFDSQVRDPLAVEGATGPELLRLSTQDKGAAAPDFACKNQDGKEVKFADLKGKKNVLLSFYPKDDTGG